MRNHLLRVLGFACLLPLYVQSAAADNTFLMQAPTASISSILARHGLTLMSPPDSHNLALVSQSDARTPVQVVNEVQLDPDVQTIEVQTSAVVPEIVAGLQLNQSTAAILDALSRATPMSYFGATVWSSYANQPATTLIRMADTHALATGANIVAVIDTGVDPNQPLLQNSIVPGYDFVNGVAGTASEWTDLDATTAAVLSNSISATNTAVQLNQSTAAILDQSTAAILDTTRVPAAFGHGTMVAGIIHLVAPTSQIMPLKVFKADGTANLSDIIRAIYFAVDNGARVINMSFSMPDNSVALSRAINYATRNNVVCVASVGNEGIETVRYPASYRNVIGVASTDNSDARSVFSNFGEALADIAAPGEGIVTTYPGGHYAIVSGTSFSAPLVSGAAALMLQLDQDLSQGEASFGFSRAKKLGNDELGFGRLDLFQAIGAIKPPV